MHCVPRAIPYSGCPAIVEGQILLTMRGLEKERQVWFPGILRASQCFRHRTGWRKRELLSTDPVPPKWGWTCNVSAVWNGVCIAGSAQGQPDMDGAYRNLMK